MFGGKWLSKRAGIGCMIFGGRHGTFFRSDAIRVNSASKDIITRINTKEGAPNRGVGLPIDISFL